MSFLELALKRGSVRVYHPTPVPEELLTKVLEAARLAPTAANRQPFRVYVLSTEAHREALGRLYPRRWFTQAPLVIGITALNGPAWVRRDGVGYAWVDATIAMDHLILAAADQGLGTCWVAAFDPEVAREILPLREGEEPVAFTPLGYGAAEPPAKKRKALEELVVRLS